MQIIKSIPEWVFVKVPIVDANGKNIRSDDGEKTVKLVKMRFLNATELRSPGVFYLLEPEDPEEGEARFVSSEDILDA